MELFPAVAICGPPHSDKSVLAYTLSRALRTRQIAHYVLRAFPDGEGDWANEADQALVRCAHHKARVPCRGLKGAYRSSENSAGIPRRT